MVENIEQEHLFQRVSGKLEVEWFPYHTDEWFSFLDIATHFDWREPLTRKALSQVVYHLYKKKKPAYLEKRGKLYRVVNYEVEELDWLNADPKKVLELRYPYDYELHTSFGFEDTVTISPGSIIIIAGASNQGKTCWLLNFLLENMDKHNCIYFTNEYTEIGFCRRMDNFDWFIEEAEKFYLTDDGVPKFRVIKRYRDYQDVMDPDGINIIDYLLIEDSTMVGMAIKSIQEKLRNGIAVIALQKPPGRDMGYGGFPTISAASLYLSIDYQKLKVVKAKDCNGVSLDNREYSFKIVHKGSKFHDIRVIQ